MLDFVKRLFFYSSSLVLNVQRFFFLILSLGAAIPSHHTDWTMTGCRERVRTGNILLGSPFPLHHLGFPPRKSGSSRMHSSTVD